MDGDDRKEFLKGMGAPVDILYCWDQMDSNNLVYFFMGKLDDKNSASSDKTPAVTTRTGGGDDNSNQKSSSKRSREKLQGEMVDNVKEISKTLRLVHKSEIDRDLEKLRDKVMGFELKMLDIDESDPRYEIYKRHKERLELKIQDLENQLSEQETAPKKLTYEKEN